MKINLLKFINLLVLLLLMTVVNCSKGEDMSQGNTNPKSDAKQIISFVFSVENNAGLSEAVTATINEVDKTISASVPFGTDISVLTPTIDVSELANVSPSGVNDFSSSVIYEVTAEDGSKVSYSVNITIDDSDSDAFITTWKTTTDNESIGFYLQIVSFVNYQIDWGDGVVENILNTAGPTHQYAIAGTYTVKIKGDYPGFSSNVLYASKIQSIDNWGDIKWKSMSYAFRNCVNLTYNATDTPDLSIVTDMTSAFQGATSFNGNISGWDVSNVFIMYQMFLNATSFNGDIGGWNVSNVYDMHTMFKGAASFNRDISDWDVSNVRRMSHMFSGATAFNQYIGSWDIGNVTEMIEMFYGATVFNQDIGSWDVGNVIYMREMFRDAISFNQDISSWNISKIENLFAMFKGATAFNQDISSWNVGNVTDMSQMFWDASAFNQDISSWDVSSVTDMSYMFKGAIVFNQDVGGWDVSDVDTMNYMFNDATTFSQDISRWGTDNVRNCSNFSTNSGLTIDQLPTAGSCF